MKRIVLLLFSFLFLYFIFLLSPQYIQAQGGSCLGGDLGVYCCEGGICSESCDETIGCYSNCVLDPDLPVVCIEPPVAVPCVCAPPSSCPSGGTCENLPTGECAIQGGVSKGCLLPGGSTGNCCIYDGLPPPIPPGTCDLIVRGLPPYDVNENIQVSLITDSYAASTPFAISTTLSCTHPSSVVTNSASAVNFGVSCSSWGSIRITANATSPARYCETTFDITRPVTSTGYCEIDYWDEVNRELKICVGGFNSITDLRNHTVIYDCTGNSNEPYGSFCRDIQNPTFDLAGTPTSEIRCDASGCYTCVIGYGLNRAIGSLDVDIVHTSTGDLFCSIEDLYTRPDDWDPLKEGLPWQKGTNEPIRVPSPLCPGQNAVNTAIGCIPLGDRTQFISFFLRWGMGIGGGIALVLIVVAGFQITTASGDPKRLQAGKELITAAIMGLVLLMFSAFILRLIGVDILQIPGL